ncbi:hypothetical protein A7985_00990 [Pseudoalteromonas luteoviolacea]|uniref:Outer membrane protein beta-barrel domain-containing protein n=1 Tax=Pseudoalteromonas luteoviolacea TaxID=43657 RepID=A0A1C0TTM6_9GAMM|nr:porin family protein [Pseudoalteromonas luteoviolacea]MBQ4811071.1 porin family protein [Pseudoalteromonas luteoviolacea]OCQ22574.1 hypothetical protein A7985_00990 [Pseudoalteromonas luteoviolacea]
MNKILPLSILSLSTFFASVVQANDESDNGFYTGAFYNSQSISIFSNDRDFKVAGFVGGYQFNKYFSVESRYGKGISGYDNSIFIESYDYKEDINYQISLSAKAAYYFTDDFKVYGMLGYTDTELKIATVAGTYIDDVFQGYRAAKIYKDVSGLSYGIGISYAFNDQFAVFLDHQRLPDFDVGRPEVSYRWDSTTLGVTYSF